MKTRKFLKLKNIEDNVKRQDVIRERKRETDRQVTRGRMHKTQTDRQT